jgi:predicted branched-subunit amino acid permease
MSAAQVDDPIWRHRHRQANSERRRATTWEGARAALPVLAGLSPLALLVGVASGAAGQSSGWTLVSSALVFSGSAQLALADLIAAGAGFGALVITGLVLNARLVAYSASFARHWTDAPGRWKALAALWLVDPTFALGVEYAERGPAQRRRLRAYFAGVGATLWLGWAGLVVVGMAVGRELPLERVGFAGPLVLIALLVPRLREGRRSASIVVTSAAVAPFAAGLPMSTGVLVAVLAGVAAGHVVRDAP